MWEHVVGGWVGGVWFKSWVEVLVKLCTFNITSGHPAVFKYLVHRSKVWSVDNIREHLARGKGKVWRTCIAMDTGTLNRYRYLYLYNTHWLLLVLHVCLYQYITFKDPHHSIVWTLVHEILGNLSTRMADMKRIIWAIITDFLCVIVYY